jgi:hypothetical protein
MNIPQTQKEPIELKIPHIISHARYVCSRFDEVSMEAFVTTGGCISRLFMTVQCHFSTIFQLNLVVNFIGRINWEYLEQN